MNEGNNIQDLPGYISIKEAAEMLGISTRRVYGHIEKGRLRAVRFADVLAIPEEELEKFKYGISGRPRQNTPPWRISPTNDAYVWLHIFVQQRPEQGNELKKKLIAVRRNEAHIFPGTAARYIALSDQRPGEVQILLVWRGSMIPEPQEREATLEELRRELADVVDWQTARYETGQVLMHT